MDFRAGNHLVSVVGESKPVYVWKRKCNRTTTSKAFTAQSTKCSRRREEVHSLRKDVYRRKCDQSNVISSAFSNIQESQEKRDVLYDSLENELAEDANLDTEPNLARSLKSKVNNQFDYPSQDPEPTPISSTLSVASIPQGALITELFENPTDDRFNYCDDIGSTVRPLVAGSHHIIEKHSNNILNNSIETDNLSHVGHGMDKRASSAGPPGESIIERLAQFDRRHSNKHCNAYAGALGIRSGISHRLTDHDSRSVGDYDGSTCSEADDAPPQQREKPLMKRSEGTSSSNTNLNERRSQRPTSARATLEQHYRNRKEKLLDEMRLHLHKRVKARKEKSIVGDDIFQRQMKSGFWTSEVLYHQWGNNILSMRSTWKENSSEEFVSSLSEEPQPPVRLRSRRQAISVVRDKRSPLTMNTMTFMAPTREEETPLGSQLDSRRRSSNLPAFNKERTFSVDQGTLPIRLDIQEDKESRRKRLRALFRDTIMKVHRITQVMMRMIASSKASTYSGLMASLHFSKADGSEDPKNFNKERYSRKYAELHVPRWAKQITAKEPWERTPEEIIRLYGVMRNMRSFEKFTRRMRMEICRAARYNECSKGRVIVRQGHVGSNFYFIFSGSVFVQLDILDESSGVMTTSNVNTLKRGSCFGELALLTNGERTASVICREMTEIFEIEKETFLEVCPDIFDNELSEKIQVALELPFFKSWPEHQLRRLCFESPIQEIDFGKVVETNPGTSEYCYVVLKGKVSLLKECDLVGALTQHCNEMMSHKHKVTPHERKDSKTDSALSVKMMEKLKALLLPEWTRNGKCHMTIGLMSAGNATDILPIKLCDRDQLAGVTLVSRGCRMMRVTKQRIEKTAPREILETFRQKHNTVLPTPSNEELFERFLVDIAWRHYRTYVTKASSGKVRRETDSTKSIWLANYLVTNALLRDKRGRLAVKERLQDIKERHQRKADVAKEEEEEEEEESDQDYERRVHLNKLKKGTLPHTFSKIEDACNI